MPNVNETLLTRMGMADALGHRAKDTARRLQIAAQRHHDASNLDLSDLSRQIQEKGVGADEGLEEQYCRGLVTRAHMIQAGHLSDRDAARMPELDQSHFQKALVANRGIYLIRHGKTKMNNEDPREDYVRGWMDVPLDDEGIEEAVRVGESAQPLGIRFILCSDLSRAATTAKIISRETGAPVTLKSQAFRPWNMGRLQGRKVDDVQGRLETYVKRYPYKAVPVGESFDEFKGRFLGALSHLLESYDDLALPTFAIVTHSRNLKLVEAWLHEGGHGTAVDGDVYLKRDAPSPGAIVCLSPTEDGWQFEELDGLEKGLPETKVKVKVKGQNGAPDVKVKVKIKPNADDQEGDEDQKEPEVELDKAVRRPFVPPDVPRWRGPRPSPDNYLPLNGVEDREKFHSMARAMADRKWEWTVPLIRCGDQLLSGSHRYAAARMVGAPIKVKDIDDVFAEAGLDFKTIWETYAQPFTGWLSNLDFALQKLPPEVRDHYGLDLG